MQTKILLNTRTGKQYAVLESGEFRYVVNEVVQADGPSRPAYQRDKQSYSADGKPVVIVVGSIDV